MNKTNYVSNTCTCSGCMEARALAAEREVARLIHVFQRYQPGGSPPPGDAAMLAEWVLHELQNNYAEAEARAKLYEGLYSVESATVARLRELLRQQGDK